MRRPKIATYRDEGGAIDDKGTLWVSALTSDDDHLLAGRRGDGTYFQFVDNETLYEEFLRLHVRVAEENALLVRHARAQAAAPPTIVVEPEDQVGTGS